MKLKKVTTSLLLNTRKQHGYTQVQFANELGISVRNYKYYETGGKAMPKLFQMAINYMLII